MPDRLYFTDSDEANALIASDPMALLVGFALDQQVSVQKAFIGVYATGGTTPQNGSNLTYTQNTLNTSGANAIRAVGLYMQGVNGATVSQNSVGNFNNADTIDVEILLAERQLRCLCGGHGMQTHGPILEDHRIGQFFRLPHGGSEFLWRPVEREVNLGHLLEAPPLAHRPEERRCRSWRRKPHADQPR